MQSTNHSLNPSPHQTTQMISKRYFKIFNETLFAGIFHHKYYKQATSTSLVKPRVGQTNIQLINEASKQTTNKQIIAQY